MIHDVYISILVYGTLKRGQVNHGLFCRNAVDIRPAVIVGRLYRLPAGFPAVVIPAEAILAHGTADPLADARTQAEVNARGVAALPDVDGDRDLVHGEVIPEEHLEAYAAAAAAQLNHQTRDCLGRRTACEVFVSGTHGSMIDRRERKEVTDELIAMAAGYRVLADDWRLVTAEKAWRLAVETWLLAHRAISVSPNRVSPTFRPEKLS